MQRAMGTVVVALMFMGMAACNANMSPILEMRDEHALSEPDEGVMYEVVRYGLEVKGWRIEDEQPGAIMATVQAGGHWGTIEIVYDDLGYAIRHVRSSPGLRYDGMNIHKRFNHWVERLDNAIQNRLRELGYKA